MKRVGPKTQLGTENCCITARRLSFSDAVCLPFNFIGKAFVLFRSKTLISLNANAQVCFLAHVFFFWRNTALQTSVAIAPAITYHGNTVSKLMGPQRVP